jgi:putative ABC transport system permease protein
VKFLPLLFANLRRKRVRTAFTLLSILVAFLLFGYLGAIRQAFSMGVDMTGADRLLTIHKVSLIQPLPESYQERVKGIAGVIDATHASWFGGIYQDPKNFFAQMAVVAEPFLRMYPEYRVPPEQAQAWLDDREGVLVGRATADRFGWKLGDRIPIQATIWTKKDGSKLWEFNVRAIYDGEKGVDTTQFLFHHETFKQGRAFGNGTVGWYILRIADPERAAEIAQAVDAEFANSSAETRTSTEKAFVQAFAKQVGDIGAILTAILSAVFFTMLLVAGNTAAQSVRERTAELAVLKTLGFTNLKVLTLVLAESSLLAILGGGLGLGLAAFLISRGDPTGGALPIFFLPQRDVVLGIALMFVLGLLTGLLPAVNAMRLRIVDALRRG